MKEIISKNIKKLNIKKLSNYLMNIGIALSILNFILIYWNRSRLPEGVCPINENYSFIILSIDIQQWD